MAQQKIKLKRIILNKYIIKYKTINIYNYEKKCKILKSKNR